MAMVENQNGLIMTAGLDSTITSGTNLATFGPVNILNSSFTYGTRFRPIACAVRISYLGAPITASGFVGVSVGFGSHTTIIDSDQQRYRTGSATSVGQWRAVYVPHGIEDTLFAQPDSIANRNSMSKGFQDEHTTMNFYATGTPPGEAFKFEWWYGAEFEPVETFYNLIPKSISKCANPTSELAKIGRLIGDSPGLLCHTCQSPYWKAATANVSRAGAMSVAPGVDLRSSAKVTRGSYGAKFGPESDQNQEEMKQANQAPVNPTTDGVNQKDRLLIQDMYEDHTQKTKSVQDLEDLHLEDEGVPRDIAQDPVRKNYYLECANSDNRILRGICQGVSDGASVVHNHIMGEAESKLYNIAMAGVTGLARKVVGGRGAQIGAAPVRQRIGM